MGASAETLELPLSTRVAMGQLDALYAAQVKATKSLKDYFVVNEDGTTTLKAGLQEHIVMLENVTNSRVKLARQINSEVQLHKEELALLRDKADLINRMAQWQSSQGPDMSGMMGRWRQGQRDALLEANAARGSMIDRMGAWQNAQGPDLAGKMAAWQAEKGAIESRNLAVQQAMAADDQWNTKQAQLNIQFIQLTRQIEVHNARIRELAASEVVDANAVEMEVRARDKLQAKLIQVDRSLSTSNAAMRNARMMTQSASYAIQDFVQGLSVGSFSMAVRGAANNVETLAATMTMGSSAAVAMGASLIPTLALVGVSLYEIYGSSKKAKEGHDEAAEAAKRYKHALDQIKDANQSLAKSENERAEATHRRLYADATSDINKSLSEVREKINAYDANSFNAPRDFRKEAAEVDAFRANFEAGLKSGALPRGTTIENASNVTSDSQYIANVAMQEMMARVDSQRELLTKEAGLRGRLASVSAEETARRGRAVREQAMDAAGGKDKFVELAARGIRSGVPAGAIRAGLAIKFGAGADEDVDGIMRAAAAKAKKDEYESKDPIEKQRQAVKKLKDDHAGAFAVGEAEKKLHAMEADDKGVLATLERIAAFLGNIDAKTDAAPPQNNVNRNNANVLEGAARFMGWNL